MSIPNFLGTERCETTPAQRHRAARAAAAAAHDAADLAVLLDMLGLTAVQGKDRPEAQAQPTPAEPRPAEDATIGRELALSMLAAVRGNERGQHR